MIEMGEEKWERKEYVEANFVHYIRNLFIIVEEGHVKDKVGGWKEAWEEEEEWLWKEFGDLGKLGILVIYFFIYSFRLIQITPN